jgi:cell division protein FtsL
MAWSIVAAGVAITVAVIAIGVQTMLLNDASANAVMLAAQLMKEREDATNAAKEKDAQYRQLEQDNATAAVQIEKEAQTKLDDARNDVVRANAASSSMQRARDLYLSKYRKAAAACAVAPERSSVSDAIDMLANLQQRADDRAGELAAIADDARIRGTACERAYDAAQKMMQQTYGAD